MSEEKKIRIYTRVGDQGETSLFSGGKVSKNDPRVDAYGTIDELNSVLGWVRCCWSAALSPAQQIIDDMLRELQHELFEIGADLATAPTSVKAESKIKRTEATQIQQLEKWIDRLESELAPLRNFILPGGVEAAARLHIARTVCRRAERVTVIAANISELKVNPLVVTYLNRLSDLLFVMARYANFAHGAHDVKWER